MQQFYLTTREGMAEAIRLAHRALELDPQFSLVAGLAGVCHLNNVIFLAMRPILNSSARKQCGFLHLALSIDDGDPETLARASLISAVHGRRS